MRKHLNLTKEKLPKKIKRKTDDDELFLIGTYNKYLNTQGYDVDATANKKIQADFPEIEGIEWLYDSNVKDYKNLLKNKEGGTPWGPCIYSAFSCFIAKITLEIEG